MALPEVASREEWLTARLQLLAQEKALTRQRDALNTARRGLPMVRVEKEYVFEGARGKVTLAEMFDGCRQLFVHHLMFGADWESACPSCTQATTEFSQGLLDRLRSRDTAFVMICHAPFDKINAYRAGRGWAVPWYSSYGNDFNYDFQVTLDESVPELVYNFRPEPDALTGATRSVEAPGASCFLRDGDEIFHTYSAYARGLDHLDAAYAYLDLTALGKQEEWEEPKGRGPALQGTL